MKVKDLIYYLNQCDPEAIVHVMDDIRPVRLSDILDDGTPSKSKVTAFVPLRDLLEYRDEVELVG